MEQPQPHCGHLIFRWQERGVSLALGLHAWEPLSEAPATLEQMVSSLPT
jgi:hypothetical protein